MNKYAQCLNSIFPTSLVQKPEKCSYLSMISRNNTSEINKKLDLLLFNSFQKRQFKPNTDDSLSETTETNNSICSKNSIIIGKSNDMYLEREENIEKKEENHDILQRTDDFGTNKEKYDEEKEKLWVERYYKVKNGILNKLRFGF